jgi:colanic acid/amylovoran biosynthesis glycosyltransferase
MSEPLVTVVIPTFNRAHCIARAIESVERQTHPSIEIIVVDDGSTDTTASLVQSLDSIRPLTLIQLGCNAGAAAARNRGIAAGKGDYVAFLDSDDEWHPRKLERQLGALSARGPEFGACYTAIASYDERGRLCGLSRAIEEGDIRELLLTHNLVGSTSAVIVRRELLRAIGGFNPALRSCQDWDLWLRLARLTRFACVPEILTVLYVASRGRITSNGSARLSGYLYMYRTHLRPHFKTQASDPTIFLTMLGEIFMQVGRPDYAARLLYRNWRAKPRSLKRLILYAMARLRIDSARYLRAVEFLQGVERHLRPSPIRRPATLASLKGGGQWAIEPGGGIRRIALLVDNFPQTSQTFIDNQILSLLARGIDVTILSFGRGDAAQRHSSTLQIERQARIIRLRVPGPASQRLSDLALVAAHPLTTWRIIWRALVAGEILRPYDLTKLVMAARGLGNSPLSFDALFCHFGPNGQIGSLLRDTGFIEGMLVTFFHGYDFSERVRAKGPHLYRRLFARGDVFVANTNFTRRRIIELGCPQDKIVTVPVGLYPDRFPYRERAKRAGHPTRFLTVGRLVEKKGHAYAIEAFRKVLDAGLRATYAIVGEGPKRAELERLIVNLGLTDSVTLLGSRRQEDIVDLADAADIFLIASTSGADGDVEGQGLVLQEAQAMGLPVIATNHNGFPEGLIDGVTGILVPERDSDDLARAMIELARQPERWASMGRAGTAFVRERFDQARLTDRLLALLLDVGCHARQDDHASLRTTDAEWDMAAGGVTWGASRPPAAPVSAAPYGSISAACNRTQRTSGNPE